jgi:hypothetical protein
LNPLTGREEQTMVGGQEPNVAVEELRLFVSLYEGVEVQPDTRAARQLEAARRAIAAYEEAQEIASSAA